MGRSLTAELSRPTLRRRLLRLAQAIRHYLDVSAVRIQDWLGRTPDLKLRRGASVLLVVATSRPGLEGQTPPLRYTLERRGRQRGRGGRRSSRPTPSTKPTLPHPGGTARAVGAAHADNDAALPQSMRSRAAGDSYAAAYPAMTRAREDGDCSWTRPGAAARGHHGQAL